MHCFLSYPKWISNLLLTNHFRIGYIWITVSTTFSLLLTLVMSIFELVYILRNECKLALTTSFGCSENSLILEPRCNRIWVLILKFFALTELFTLLLSYLFLSRLRNRFLNQIKSIQHFFFFLGWLDWFFDFGRFLKPLLSRSRFWQASTNPQKLSQDRLHLVVVVVDSVIFEFTEQHILILKLLNIFFKLWSSSGHICEKVLLREINLLANYYPSLFKNY